MSEEPTPWLNEQEMQVWRRWLRVQTELPAALVTLVNIFMGTLIAWVLVRDEFPGKRVVNALIDLPFALPTIVAGITLLALYGNNSPVGVNIGYSRPGVVLALAFVTLPFVVRSVQPVLLTMEPDMEEAARCLGAGPLTSFRRIVLPTIAPALLAGCTVVIKPAELTPLEQAPAAPVAAGGRGGPGLGGGRRPVRLRGALPLADDRRQGATVPVRSRPPQR